MQTTTHYEVFRHRPEGTREDTYERFADTPDGIRRAQETAQQMADLSRMVHSVDKVVTQRLQMKTMTPNVPEALKQYEGTDW